MADKDAYIAVKDLTLAYGSHMAQKLLNYTINRGEIFVFMEGGTHGLIHSLSRM